MNSGSKNTQRKNMDYKQRYKKYRSEVQEQMNIIIDNSEIEDAYVTILDLLALNYDMLFESVDNIKSNGFEKKDFKDRLVKNHAVQTLNNCQQTIIKLLNSFPSTPLAKAKIKKLTDLDDNYESPLDEYI